MPTLGKSLRSHCALYGFARKELLPRDIFLAKSQRSQRRSMNILQRLRTAFHGLCSLSAMFFVYSCTLQMSDTAHADIMGQLCLQNTDLSSISISNDAIIGKDGRKAMGKPLLNYFRHCAWQSTCSAPMLDGKAMWRLLLFPPLKEGIHYYSKIPFYSSKSNGTRHVYTMLTIF